MGATRLVRGQSTSILVLNPNSSQAMTDGMKKVIETLYLPASTEISTYTAPSASPSSINDADGISKSAHVVFSDMVSLEDSPGEVEAEGRLRSKYRSYDAILIACFSVHPLVRELQIPAWPRPRQGELGSQGYYPKRPAVTGIFEASILTALSLLGPGEKWGIVTTGKFWEDHLTQGVAEFLGINPSTPPSSLENFVGVHSTGLNAGDFHKGVPKEEVERRLKKATKELLSGGETTVVVMGCAGMAGLEDIIRSAAEEDYGKVFAYSALHVVDGVRAGLVTIEQIVRQGRMRPGLKDEGPAIEC